MKVQGVEVPQYAIDQAIAAMKRQVGFQAYHVYVAIRNAILDADGSLDQQFAQAAAGRVIQRERIRGNIGVLNAERKHSTYWRWIGTK